jgi:hypothetical protein
VARVVGQVRLLVCQRLSPAWQQSEAEVARLLRQSVRASSAVACRNRVLRRHQGRHRQVSQSMLDLKRLYWNGRSLLTGKRKDRCP